ncbi:MAG: ATP-binding cassette domain-containing protein [Clostridiales bacterium]|jgi:ABC-type nitrate/sulfonate/bicarbonate transport system ATPase subunit/ABC-type nitrate/sulfonate/bicarbonate transport system permease component|nr:ATP-binding cassette domain-containing protein [Clostridiales bacterium]
MNKTKNGGLKKVLRTLANNVLFPFIAFGLLIAVWAIVAAAEKKPIIFPVPAAIFREFFELTAQSAFYKAAAGTLGRALESYALSFASALIFASLGTAFRSVHKILSPLVTVLRAAPTMAIILLAVLWLNGAQSPVLIGFLISFPLLYSSVYSALSATDKDLLEMSAAFKMRKRDIFTGIYMPSVLPSVFDAVKSTVSLNVKVVIAAEVMALTRGGMGLEMYKNNLIFNISGLLAWTAAAVVLSFLLELAAAGLKKLTLSETLKRRFFAASMRLTDKPKDGARADGVSSAERGEAEKITAVSGAPSCGSEKISPPEFGVTLKNITKAYGDLRVFDGFSFTFGAGVTCVLGASGSGKTTLLNIISGVTSYEGENNVKEGDFSYIFQNDRLINNITVYKNLDLILRTKVRSRTERRRRIYEALKLVELEEYAGKLPSELSGGQGQRIAMARAFIYPAPVLLMDEPFKALDIALKERLASVFLRLFGDASRVVVFVTHDIFEAIKLADRAVVLGGAPAKILFETKIDTPKPERRAFAAGMEQIKAALYGALTEE